MANYKINDVGELIITADIEEQLKLLDAMYPYGEVTGEPLSFELRTAFYEYQKEKWKLGGWGKWKTFPDGTYDKDIQVKGWGRIEQEFYNQYVPSLQEDGFIVMIMDQDFAALWGGPIIVQAEEDYEGYDGDLITKYVDVKGCWTDHQYVLFDSPAGIDTLAKTGKAIWSLVPLEEEDKDG